MFTQVRLKNFKSFAEQEIDLRRFSVFIGPNGSGKSSVLQSLQVWKASVGHQALQVTSESFDLGSLGDVVRSPEAGTADLGFTSRTEVPVPTFKPLEKAVPVVVSADAAILSNTQARFRFVSELYQFTTARDQYGSITVEGDSFKVGDTTFTVNGNELLPGLYSLSTSTQGTRNPALMEDGRRFLNASTEDLNRIRVVPAIRGFTLARYPLGQERLRDMSSRIDPQRNSEDLATSLAYDTELRERVSELMADITGVAVSLTLDPNRLVAAVSRRPTGAATNKQVVPTNEGFGTNQLIHLISQVLVTPAAGTTLIEEPETHLHPSSQVKLAAWLADHAVSDDKQFILTTHSEHFLAGLLWQVREKVLAPSDLALFYLTLDPSGESQVRRLDVTQGGISQGSYAELFAGPEGYPGFGEFVSPNPPKG